MIYLTEFTENLLRNLLSLNHSKKDNLKYVKIASYEQNKSSFHQ
jgi:hypothetical protein